LIFNRRDERIADVKSESFQTDPLSLVVKASVSMHCALQ
jgi:hypothetical protein